MILHQAKVAAWEKRQKETNTIGGIPPKRPKLSTDNEPEEKEQKERQYNASSVD